jgi:Na+-translocating ferredoxin:NAD+ oxidoreductase RnfG subunit
MPSLPRQTAQAMVGELSLKQVSRVLEKTEGQTDYFEVLRAEPNAIESGGYVFSSQDFAPEVRGFGGRINLAIYVDADFNLIDFQVVRSNETPSYLRLLDDWEGGLKGRRLLGAEPFGDIDAVSGATVTSEAILLALSNSANTFARDVLGVSSEGGVAKVRPFARYVPDARAAYLIAATALAVIVIYFGGFWSRLFVLAASCVVGGLVLNAQYSTEQAATILSLHAPVVGLSGAFMLVAGVPILVALFGNIYCGYICPFGAAQELLSYVIPRQLKRPLAVEAMRKARFLKYAILFLLIGAFFVSRSRTTLSSDPLINVFGMQLSVSDIRWPTLDWQSAWPWILAVALVGSIFYTRFWCRYLCPAGAFLSLFNKVALLGRLAPAKRYGRCEFGLTAKDKLDCIYCDRCRYEMEPSEGPVRLMEKDEQKAGVLSRSLVGVVLTVTILISAVSIDRLITVLPSYEDYTAYSIASGGQPRDVDLRRIEDLIRQKKLSDKEAEFYKRIE